MNAVAVAAFSAVVACSVPLAAQEARTGVSTPPAASTENLPSGVQEQGTTPGYQPTPTVASPGLVRRSASSSFSTTSSVPATTPEDRDDVSLSTRPKGDVDAGIVTTVSHAADELPVGTTFKARMRQTLSTATTPSGTAFSAELIEPVEQDGLVLIPSGTVVEGRVTGVHGGRRIHGAATLHLDPRTLVLPDGSRREIHAQVIDTSESFATRIDGEGTIVRRDHLKATLAVLGATTGTAAVAGAVAGGGVGALVGAGIGAGIGAAWWLKQDRQTVLPEQTAVTFSLNEPITMGRAAR